MGMNKEIQKAMLDYKFDDVNFSIHAAKSETYKKLQARNFDLIKEFFSSYLGLRSKFI